MKGVKESVQAEETEAGRSTLPAGGRVGAAGEGLDVPFGSLFWF